MEVLSRFPRRLKVIIVFIFSLVFIASSKVPAYASASEKLIQLSSDPYTNATSQHRTEVEPDAYSFGSTIVAAFQAGRFTDAASSNIGWATSTNGGKTWAHGFLPGITKIVNPANPYDRATDPSVAYDAKHKVWIISSLALLGSSGAAVLVSRSRNGGLTWGDPVTVNLAHGDDKDWIVCDDAAASPFYGHCYTQWTDNGLIEMSTSTNGGKTWESPKTTADDAGGLAGQPLVQPGGTVIVPFFKGPDIEAFTSTDGGNNWSSTVTIATPVLHRVNGNLRAGASPSAEIDKSGKVYVVWQDCRFESGCMANDLVMSTSTNGTVWSAVQRIPIDPVGSGVDHFLPGLAVDKRTSGSKTHLALAFYYYPVASCTVATCQLDVGFISSTNGGAGWSQEEQLAGPMQLTWLAMSVAFGGAQFYFVGDYISTSFSGDDAFPMFAVAKAPSGGHFNEAIYTTVEDA